MEERDKELEEIKLAVARNLEVFTRRIANKPEASEPELMAMTRAATAVSSLGFSRY